MDDYLDGASDCSDDPMSPLESDEEDDGQTNGVKKPRIDLTQLAYLNSDGTYFCPICPGRKKQDYRYNELLTHARGQAGKSSKADSRSRRQHWALQKKLEEDKPESSTAQTLANKTAEKPPERPEDVRYVWPWRGLLTNIKTVQGDKVKVGVSREEIKEKFKEFEITDAQVFYDCRGNHSGIGMVEFGGSSIGWDHAVAFQKAFITKKRGLGAWLETKGRHLGEGMYGWLLEEKHLVPIRNNDPFPWPVGLKQYIEKKAKQTKSPQQVRVEEKEQAEKQRAEEEEARRKLAKEKEQQKKEILRLVVAQDETEQQLRRWKEEAVKASEQLREKEHQLAREKAHNARLQKQRQAELDKQREMLERFAEELQQGVQGDANASKLEDVTQQLQNVNLKQKERDGLSLKQQAETAKHEDVMELLKLFIENKQQMERDLLHLSQEGESKETEAMAEFKKMIKAKEEEINGLKQKLVDEVETKEMHQDTVESLTYMHEKLKTEVTEGRATALELLQEDKIEELMQGKKHDGPAVGIKRTGELDDAIWHGAGAANGLDPGEVAVLISKWTDKITSSQRKMGEEEFNPTKHKNGKLVGDEDHPEIVELTAKLGKEVSDDVIRAVLEREEFNASGGYCRQIVWNFDKNEQATFKDVVELLDALLLKQEEMIKSQKKEISTLKARVTVLSREKNTSAKGKAGKGGK